MTAIPERSTGILVIPTRIRPALAELLTASDYAEQTLSEHWEFAVEMERLAALGLQPNDFRWLVRNKLVEHQQESTCDKDNGRIFHPTGDLSFPERTCFVLTRHGVLLAKNLFEHERVPGAPHVRESVIDAEGRYSTSTDVSRSRASAPLPDLRLTGLDRPFWDAELRELRFQGKVVKSFRWVASNQEAVIAAFQEESWPRRIDDPLTPEPELDSKRRLNDTIKCLNRKQTHSLIHFRGDGTGEGIIWEPV